MKLEISTGSIIRVVLVLIGFYAIYFLRDIVLILLTSAVVASAVEPGAKFFRRWGLNQLFAVILVYLLAFVFFAAAVVLLAGPLAGELGQILQVLPERLGAISDATERFGPLSSWAGELTGLSFADLRDQLESFTGQLSHGVLQTVSSIFGGVLSFVLILVFSFYLAVQPGGVDNLLRLISPAAQENYVVGLWHRARGKIGRWVQGQLLLGVLIAVLTYLGLTILNIKYALVLSLLMIVFELIPVFGPVLGAVPAVIIGLNESLTAGLLVLGWYIIIQQFENHLIYPLVVRKIIGVPPLVVIIALLAGVKLAGFLGIILAVPVATLLMELADDLEKTKKGQALPV